MTDGVAIKISADDAIKGQQALDAALAKSLDTVTTLSSRIVVLETELAKLAALQKGAAGASAPLAKSAADTSTSIAVMTTRATAAAPPISKLLSAAGQGGAARGLGLLAAGARTVITGLNPMALVVGAAATALFAFGDRLIAAETPLDKMTRSAREAAESVSLLERAVAGTNKTLSAVAEADAATFGAKGIDDAITKVARLSAEIEKARTQLAVDIELAPDLKITTEQLIAFADVLKLTNADIKRLEAVGKQSGEQQVATLAKLREAGIKLKAVYGSIALGIGTKSQATVFLDAAAAANLLANKAAEVDKRLVELRNSVVNSPADFKALTDSLYAEIDALSLGNKERQVKQRLDELAKTRVNGLTAAQKEQADASRQLARYIDEQADATKRLADAGRDAERDAKQRIEQGQRYADVLQEIIDKQNDLKSPPEERELRARIRDAQNDAGVDPLSQKGQVLDDKVRAAQIEKQQTDENAAALRRLNDAGADATKTLATGLLDAAIEGRNLQDALADIGVQIAKLLAQRAIIRAIDLAFGTGTGAPAGSPPPGGFQLGGILPRPGQPTYYAARGIVLDRYQTINTGRMNVAVAEGGASTPEAVLPLQRDEYGRLGVIASAGGGTTVINMPGVRSAADARRIRPTLTQAVESINRQGRRGMRAGR